MTPDDLLPIDAFKAWGPPGQRRMTLHGGGGAPDPDPMVAVAQNKLADLAVRQQEWYETNLAPKVLDQLDQSLSISKQQADKASELQDYQMGLSKKYDDRYWGTQVPLEDQLIDQAKSYNQASEQEAMAGQAGADVAQANASGQSQLGRGLRMRGINTGSAASISALADMQSNADLAKAGTMNKTRETARQMGWQRMGEAAALGRGLPSFGAGSSALAMSAGQTALSAGTAGGGAVNTAGQTSNQATTTQGNLWNGIGGQGLRVWQTGVDIANAENANNNQMVASGMGALGTIAGAYFGTRTQAGPSA